MGLKEMWERYQTAAAFAEAGEHETARLILERASKEERLPEKKGRPAHVPGKGPLRPSHAEG